MTRCAADRLGPGAALVNGDAEQLPFRAGAFDLVVSTSTLQWIEDMDAFFRQCHRVVQPDGLLCIAFFGGRTMRELQECYREAVGQRYGCSEGYLDRLHRFREIPAVQEALGLSDFGSVRLSRGLKWITIRTFRICFVPSSVSGPVQQHRKSGAAGWGGDASLMKHPVCTVNVTAETG